jgi:DNA-binding transcriptional LysR family regulator
VTSVAERPVQAMQVALPLVETDLVLLRAAARATSLADAARLVGLTPQVARRRLDRLEHRLGLELLHRDAGRVSVTPAGQRVLAAGAALLAAIAAAAQATVDAAAGTGRPDLPRLRLAGFGTNWDTFADDLAAGLPGVLLELMIAEPAAAAELYDRQQVDVVYAWQVDDEPLALSRTAHRCAVVDEPLWVALPATHPSAAEETVPLGRLVADRWLTGTTEQSVRLVRATGAAAGFVPRIGQPVGSAPAARSMVAQGLGVMLVSPLATPPGPGARLVHRPVADPPRRRHVLLFDPGVVDDRLARLVAHRLRRHYASTAARRNPAYRTAAGFPVPHPDRYDPTDDPAVDPALLAGLGAPGRPVPAGRLTLDDVQLLHAVAATGSLNRAARVLLVSQPALSRRVRRLEETLGTVLLVRSHRGTVLSPLAGALLNQISDAVAAFRAALVPDPR